jgi:hypothetical protein
MSRGTLADMAPEPETSEMQIEQKRKEESHRDAAEDATEAPEARAEERRADKAAYLREKLDERARSEDETD